MTGKMLVVATVSLTLLASMSMVGAIAPEKVQGGSAEQFRPSSNGTEFAWNQFKSLHADVFVRPLDDPSAIKRVNLSRTSGWMGSFMQGTDEIVYQQVEGRSSNLWVYHVSTKLHEKLKDPVSTKEWEWWPAASPQWVLFLRDVLDRRGRVKKTQLMLADQTGGGVKALIPDVGRRFVIPNYAGDTYVSWTACGREACNVFFRNLDTDVTKQLPLASGRNQYASFIDEVGGFIYFVRSGLRCGQSVTIRRTTIADTSTSVVLTDLPRGIDTDWMISVTENPVSMNQDLYFGRYNCRRNDTDVYVLPGADTFSARARARVEAGGGSWRASMRPGPKLGASPRG